MLIDASLRVIEMGSVGRPDALAEGRGIVESLATEYRGGVAASCGDAAWSTPFSNGPCVGSSVRELERVNP